MGRWGNALIFAAVLLAGCASVQNTPQQERTWAAYAVCRTTVPRVQISRVAPDGRYWYWANDTSYGFEQFNACMREEIAKRK